VTGIGARGAAVGVGLLVVGALSGCVPSAYDRATELAAADLATRAREASRTIETALAAAPGRDLRALAESGALGSPLVAEGSEAAVTGAGETGAAVLHLAQSGQRGELLLVSVGFGEAGNLDYTQRRVFGCWTVELDLDAWTTGAISANDCPRATSAAFTAAGYEPARI
jgi:hypothetical protein